MKPEAHNRFPSKQQAPRYLPDFSVTSILQIDFAKLQKSGVRHVLFDLDLTLRKKHADELEAAIIDYLVDQHAKGAFETLSLATNNIHDVSAFSEPLAANVFQPFYSKGRIIHKPHALFFQRILDTLRAQPHEVVMIGDKIKADVGAGNRMGMHTILVAPIDKDSTLDKLRLLRLREKRLLRKARASLALVQEAHKT